MYEKKLRKLNIDWTRLITKMLILLAVLFVVLWVISLFCKNNTQKNASNLAVNLKTMQSAANKYFTGSRLPEYINDKKKVALGEMIDSKLLIELKDQDNNLCDAKESYAEATKIGDDNYTIKVKLVCGKESDYVIDTMTIKTDNTIVDNIPSDNDLTNDDNSASNGSSVNNSNNDSNDDSSNSGSSTVNKPITTPASSKVNVRAISINYKKIYVNVGSNKSVMVVIYPTNATDKTVTWTSSNSSVATVNNGVITGISEGNATITASAGGKSTSMEVQVLANSNGGNNNSSNNS
ncbi:MAG: Ig-like domain-containing protein, partial [Bacilli bacterium]|nr:Ig-like domain-containing protein [Bacilli bacterium]